MSVTFFVEEIYFIGAFPVDAIGFRFSERVASWIQFQVVEAIAVSVDIEEHKVEREEAFFLLMNDLKEFSVFIPEIQFLAEGPMTLKISHCLASLGKVKMKIRNSRINREALKYTYRWQ